MQKEAYEWYESQKVGLGELFLTELENKYNKITTTPFVYSKRQKEYRHVVLKKFPYVIVFKIIKRTVVVYAVFHTSRNLKNII
jgi:hypothetical protein